MIKMKFQNDPDLINIQHYKKNAIYLDDSSDAPIKEKKQNIPLYSNQNSYIDG